MWHSCACCTSLARSTACTTALPVQPQTPESIAAQLLTQFRGQHIGLLAPLVVNRKGVYTELADWARPRGYTHLRVDGKLPAHHQLPAHRPFQQHTIELPVASPRCLARERACWHRAGRCAHARQGRGACPSSIGTLAAAMERRAHRGHRHLQVYSTKRLPRVRHQLCRAGPCAFFRTTASTAGAPTAWARALSSPKNSARCLMIRCWPTKKRPRADLAEPEVEDLDGTTRLPHLPGHAPERHGPRREVCRRGCIADIAASSAMRRWVGGLRAAGGMTQREADIARDPVPEIQSRLEFLEDPTWADIAWTGARPRLSGARPSAFAWRRSWAATCRACATCSTNPPSAFARATTRFCSTPCTSWATRATRWWWWSTTKTPSAAPTTSSTLAPAPGTRWPPGGAGQRIGRCRPGRPSQPAATCCTPCATRCRHAGRWLLWI